MPNIPISSEPVAPVEEPNIVYEWDPETAPLFILQAWHEEIQEWIDFDRKTSLREAREAARHFGHATGRRVRVEQEGEYPEEPDAPHA